MTWTLKAVLLGAATVLFLLALLTDSNGFDLFMIGAACFAGAFLVEELGIGGRKIIR